MWLCRGARQSIWVATASRLWNLTWLGWSLGALGLLVGKFSVITASKWNHACAMATQHDSDLVDERTLYDIFSRFGQLISAPKVARDDVNMSKGYGFISYADFDASDNAITNMHNQTVASKQISVQYAYKKDGKGERHGDEAERLLAQQAKQHGVAPAVQPLPAHLFQVTPAPAPPAHSMGRGPMSAPNAPSGYGNGPPRASMQQSLPPAPSGLPARPPSGASGNYYPPPAAFGNPPPPGFNQPPHGFNQPPPGYNQPPPGFGR